jgi:hypothetical protein
MGRSTITTNVSAYGMDLEQLDSQCQFVFVSYGLGIWLYLLHSVKMKHLSRPLIKLLHLCQYLPQIETL